MAVVVSPPPPKTDGKFDDWMYLMENGTIINRSQFRKFGVKVAELVATMRPAEAQAAQRPADMAAE